MKRHRNGRIKSKRDYEIECKTRNYTLMITFFTTLVFSIAFHPWTGTYQSLNIETKTANAQEIQEEIEPASIEPVYSDKVQQAINEIPHTSSTTEAWIAYLYTEAPKHDVDPDEVARTIWCESSWYNIQSGYIYPNGSREDSWGVLQVNLPSHKNITREQALDPYFSIDWALDNWEGEKWYGLSRSSQKCTNGVKMYW